MSEIPGFTEDQKQYLEGFITGVASKRGIGLPNGAAAPAPVPAEPATSPDAIHRAAQDRTVAAGGALVPEEIAKRDKHPFEIWDEIAANAAAGRFPSGLDV